MRSVTACRPEPAMSAILTATGLDRSTSAAEGGLELVDGHDGGGIDAPGDAEVGRGEVSGRHEVEEAGQGRGAAGPDLLHEGDGVRHERRRDVDPAGGARVLPGVAQDDEAHPGPRSRIGPGPV